jgi:hypothetical protein
MMSSGRARRIIEEGRFGIKPGPNFAEYPFHALGRIRYHGIARWQEFMAASSLSARM